MGIVDSSAFVSSAPIHLAKSERADGSRASIPFRAAASSAATISERARSASLGTKTVGGVSLMLPSIVGWVVLLKNAASS